MMKAKLIKEKNGIFHLWLNVGTKDADHIASNEPLVGEWGRNLLKYKLSLKNCQAIERGYDLDELAKSVPHTCRNDEDWYKCRAGFIEGFKEALKLMSDRKFSENDIKKIIHWSTLNEDVRLTEEELFQSLQQNEWEVEILMEEVSIGDKYTPDPKPKLDADGCLILKRVTD